jgi:CDP-glucose 4,6-dehydratase
VFVTGHTGFKGGWLVAWLNELGAVVHGFALDPPTDPSLFEVADIGSLLASDIRGDVGNLSAIRMAMRQAQPEVVFHLAAQPLVRAGYADPIETFRTNTLGSAHVLEAGRGIDSLQAVVLVSTDKVYDNDETGQAFQESDRLGGRDPYSASKAAAELVIASYRSSFYADAAKSPRVASARAGNVIGGGDWAIDRLVPDCLRAFAGGRQVMLRNRSAVRPWQHVLEPLSGYLTLAERLMGPDGRKFASAWNFGPAATSEQSVGDLAQMVADAWGPSAVVTTDSATHRPHEATLLRLDTTRARTDLGWAPRLTLPQAVDSTVAWHRAWLNGRPMLEFTQTQIRDYRAAK